MEMNLQFNLEDLTTSAISPSYLSSDEDMEVDIESVEATGEPSDDSDIEVIACYRHVPGRTGISSGTADDNGTVRLYGQRVPALSLGRL